MKSHYQFSLLLLLGIYAAVFADQLQSEDLPPSPNPVTNNAVAAVTIEDTAYVVSFAGLALGKTHAEMLDATWVLNVASGHWAAAKPLPGEACGSRGNGWRHVG